MPQSKVNLSTYAVRNRVLRYGKRYRQYWQNNGQTLNFWSFIPFILIVIILCLFMFYVFSCTFDQIISNHVRIEQEQSQEKSDYQNIKNSNATNESQINEPVLIDDFRSWGMIHND